MSLLTFMEDPSIPTWYKKRKWDTAPAGAKREYFYEKYARNPAKREIGGLIDKGPLGLITGPKGDYRPGDLGIMSGKAGQSFGNRIANDVTPEDLQGAGSAAGAIVGTMRGHPFLGAELGGTLGGMAQGRGTVEAGARALPAALANSVLPFVLKKFFASSIARTMSNKASKAFSTAASGLFSPQFIDKLPDDPAALADFFAKEGPAVQNTGKRLGDFRNILKTQPAFSGQAVQVPIKTIHPQTGMPITRMGFMSMDQAIDYQAQLQGRGWDMKGMPRGGIIAEPDRQMASMVRRSIANTLNQIPGVGPSAAEMYSNLSRDYGLSQTMGDIITRDAIDPQGNLIHEKVYGSAFDPKQSTHLNNLVGPDQTRNFLSQIAPGRQRIEVPSADSARVHGGPLGVHIPIPQTPTGPAAFSPLWPKVIGPAAAAGVTQPIEGAQ